MGNRAVCFLFVTLCIFWGGVPAVWADQASFMDLWCRYGGKECEQKTQTAPPAPSPAPARVPVPTVEKTPPQMTTPLIKRDGKVTASQGVVYGQYYALVIGNNTYEDMPNLKTAIGDAKAVADQLRQAYGFSVTLLKNVNRDGIIRALDEYRKILTENDNLLIYYAGHGWQDAESERGYWLPVDARKDTRARWVSNADITDTLKALKARHVLVVADSCYSGTLTREAPITRGLSLKERPAGYVERLMSLKSRTVLSSGSLEPVVDGGGGKHSVFADAFLKALQKNTGSLDGTEMFSQVRKQVLLNARQTPQYSDIRFAGHEVGGDFVFVRQTR